MRSDEPTPTDFVKSDDSAFGADALDQSLPKVSVIIPNFNHARFLRERIDSVLQQTFRDIEVIYLDDCSTDDSKDVFSEFASDHRVKSVFNKTNSGNPFKQWNTGIRLAKGEYVWIAESDDYADQSFLAEMVNVLDQNPNAGLAYCHSPFVDESGKVSDWSLGEKWNHDFIESGKNQFVYDLLKRNVIPNASAVLVRKSVFENVGLAEESMSFCGDWATWVKIAMASDVAFVATPLNYYRRHTQTVSVRVNRTLLFIEEQYRVISYIKNHVSLSKELLDEVCESLAHLWLEFFFTQPAPKRMAHSIKIYKLAKQVDPRLRIHLLKCSLIRLLQLMHLWAPLSNIRDQLRRPNTNQVIGRPTL